MGIYVDFQKQCECETEDRWPKITWEESSKNFSCIHFQMECPKCRKEWRASEHPMTTESGK